MDSLELTAKCIIVWLDMRVRYMVRWYWIQLLFSENCLIRRRERYVTKSVGNSRCIEWRSNWGKTTTSRRGTKTTRAESGIRRILSIFIRECYWESVNYIDDFFRSDFENRKQKWATGSYKLGWIIFGANYRSPRENTIRWRCRTRDATKYGWNVWANATNYWSDCSQGRVLSGVVIFTVYWLL